MKPQRLRMRAFGPYVDEQQVDFAALARHPLFLVHGPTGAGKTSILDAICFALYGAASGSERAARQLRSQHAAPDVLTEVELDFRIGDASYRICRQPAQKHPLKRGSGLTKDERGPFAWLWRRVSGMAEEEEGKLLAEGAKAVNDHIERLLGLNIAQFRQAVVLPQGEFRALLAASTQDRAAILQRLFDTHLFEAVEQALHEHEKKLEAERDALAQQQRGLLQAHDVEDEQALHARLQELDKAIAHKTSDIATLEEREKHLALALQRAEDIARRLARAQETRQALHALQQRSPHFKKLEQRLQQARAAAALQTLADSHQQAQQRAQQAQARLQLAEETLTQARKALQQAKAAHAAAMQDQQRIQTLAADITRLQELLPHIRHLAGLQKQERDAAQQVQQAQDSMQRVQSDLQQAEEALTQLLKAHQAAAAHELSLCLRPGDPCPVCGATEHPAPAHARQAVRDSAPTSREVEQARKRCDDLRRREQQAQKVLAQAQQRQAQLAGELKVLLHTVPEQWRDATAAQAALDEMRHSLKVLTERSNQAEKDLHEARKVLEVARATCGTLQQSVEEARQAAQQAEQKLHASLQAAGFDSMEQWRAACMPEDEINACQRELDKWRHQLTEAHALAQQAEADAQDLQLEDAEAMREELQTVRGTLHAAREQLGEMRQRHSTLQKVLESVRKQAEELAALHQRHGAVQRLSALMRGNNPHRISLHRHVLAALLDEVLAAASQRLRIMSNGRYTLHRRMASRRGGGLDLDVMDNFSGEMRAVQTLSGGEGFLAALALALGLADVVQARAGALRMETLFIDEGFGSLDAESLDRALDALLRLKGEGRLIGIVSHLEELRERIPAHIEVIAQRHGSRVHVHA